MTKKEIIKKLEKHRNEIKHLEEQLYQETWQDAVSDGAIVCSLSEYIDFVHKGTYPSLDGVEYGYGG